MQDELTVHDIVGRGVSLDVYRARWQQDLARPLRGLDRTARRYLHYARYNWERYHRVFEQYEPSQAFRAVLERITSPQDWLVITEDWCADAAYSLPVFARAAETNRQVWLRLVRRDEHPEVMDRYLTNGARAIPKLVVFGARGDELFRWGAKPAALYRLREDWKARGIEGHELSKATIAWYESGGWLEVERELAALLETTAVRG
ncbi:thioredoxin family protein [Rhodocaloribacter litoris]|uniref:thioredoxin family protein n=1 Tax=Rhodocaloribacter litoris TaxID=2558931 RepID=UPI00142043B1|nr:thioredoxin family protein [Rhodocaloribacter litoris]QXD15351.1 thioredoxin family protein [Rhodocaloribacter litoris]